MCAENLFDKNVDHGVFPNDLDNTAERNKQ